MDSTVRVIFLGDAASAVRSVNTLEGRMGSMGATAARTGKIMAGAFGIGLAGAIVKATSLAIGFDRSMRNVNSIAHLNEKQFQALSKQVLALGKVSGQAPKVLADGLYDIVSSGFKAKDALTILHASAIAATAGMTDTATASKGVVAVLNAYHLGANKARNVSSMLFKEVQLGVNTFGELASQIGDTAPLASQLKVPFSDVAAGLALITLHGTSMAEASTQMARVMTDLLKPSKGLSAELKSLGYENGQAAIQAHGFVPLIKQLSDAAGGSAVKTAAWFQNIRSLRGLLNLTGPNLQKFNSFAKQMGDSMRKGGDDTKAFNEQSKSIAVRWDKATASLAAGAIKLGTDLFPALTTGIGYLSNFAGWLDKLSGKHSITAKVEFIGNSAEQYAEHVRSLISQALLGGNKGASNPSTQRLHQPGMPPVDLKFQQGFVQKAQTALSGVNWKAVGVTIGAAIGSSITIGAGALDNIGKSMVAWANGPGGGQAAEVGLVIALNMINKLADPAFWFAHWQLIGAVLLNAISVAFPEGKLLGIGEKFLAKPLIKAMLKLVPGLKGVAEDALLAVAHVFERIGGSVVGVAVRVVDAILRGMTKGFGKLGTLIRVLVWDVILTSLGNLAVSAYTAAVNVAHRIVAGIKAAAGFLTGLAGDLGNKIGPALSQAASSAYKWALGIGKQIAQGAKDGAGNIAGWIAGLIPGAGGGVQSLDKALAAKIKASQGVKTHADGGVIDRPMLSMIGEDAPRFAEFVIPTNPRYRERALGLLGQAQSALGIPGFAAGGGPKKVPHKAGHKTHQTAINIKGLLGDARESVHGIIAAQQAVSDAQRSYDQADRTFGLTPDQFTMDAHNDPSDPAAGSHTVINQTGINARVSELNDLLSRKDHIIQLLDAEKRAIEKAIHDVQKAIDTLLAAIKALNAKAEAEADTAAREHGLSAKDTARVHDKGGLQDQVAAERAKKKPNRALIARLESQIKDAGRSHDSHEKLAKAAEVNKGRYHGEATKKASQVHDLRTTLGGLNQQHHDLPFDLQDQRIDVESLKAEMAADLATTVAPYVPGTPGLPLSVQQALADAALTPGTADDLAALNLEQAVLQGQINSATDGSVQVSLKQALAGVMSQITSLGSSSTATTGISADILAQLATYRAAVNLQGRQLNVLGGMPSFERGTLHVNNDMVAQLHAGEGVLTRDRMSEHMRNQTANGPITVHVTGVAVTDQMDVWIEQNGQRIAAKVNSEIGRSADLLRRSNRVA